MGFLYSTPEHAFIYMHGELNGDNEDEDSSDLFQLGIV